jgi:hypothetical protein
MPTGKGFDLLVQNTRSIYGPSLGDSMHVLESGQIRWTSIPVDGSGFSSHMLRKCLAVSDAGNIETHPFVLHVSILLGNGKSVLDHAGRRILLDKNDIFTCNVIKQWSKKSHVGVQQHDDSVVDLWVFRGSCFIHFQNGVHLLYLPFAPRTLVKSGVMCK